MGCSLNRNIYVCDWSAYSISDAVLESTGVTHKSWPRKGQLSAVVLSVNYDILHKIGLLANLMISSHGFGVSPQLTNLIFQLGVGTQVDFEAVIYEQIMRHANSFAIKLPISFS